jgi:hypothetical protein
MKIQESVPVLFIIGYVMVIFSFMVMEYEIKFQNYEPKPISMVELFGNGTTRSFEVENTSPDPDLTYSILLSLNRFVFAFPFVIVGIGIIGAPMAFSSATLIPPEGYRVVAFWIAGIGVSAIAALSTRNIPLWRRLPYIYFIMVIISGTPVLLNENFGN